MHDVTSCTSIAAPGTGKDLHNARASSGSRSRSSTRLHRAEYDIEASAQRLSHFVKFVSKILAVLQQLKVDVRQHFRIDKRVSAMFVMCNYFKTTLGQNLETKIDKRDCVAKRAVMCGCTGTLDKNFGEATFVNRRSTCREKELLDGCTLWFYREMGHKWKNCRLGVSRKKPTFNEFCSQKC